MTNVMTAAWAMYRRDNARGLNQQYTLRQRLSVYLRQAWNAVRQRAANAKISAELAAMRAAYVRPTNRIDQINEELRAMEMADFIDWPAYNALLAEKEKTA